MSLSATEPDGRDRKPSLRTGYTTGACSAAAAKAAARVLARGVMLTEIESTLPNKSEVTFALERCDRDGDKAICSIIKDAGDDPDCTHGAELTAAVELKKEPGIELRGGEGVATVTKPGLGLEVGLPAINPVPRKNISAMVEEELAGSPYRGAVVTISVPGGEEMARKTLNARLGLIGGISILGTTGIVKPYSTAAFRASVVQAIDVAHHRGNRRLVLTTGGKSEKYAMALYPELAEEAFIQMGDFVGVAVKHCAQCGIEEVHIVGMIGKLSKLADGQTMTHSGRSPVNLGLLVSLAGELGASEQILARILAANTARHVLEICNEADLADISTLICKKTVEHLTRHTADKLNLRACLLDFEGRLIGQYPEETI